LRVRTLVTLSIGKQPPFGGDILKDEYGVDFAKMTYYAGLIEEPNIDWKHYFAETDILDVIPYRSGYKDSEDWQG